MKLKLLGIMMIILMTFSPFLFGQTTFIKAPNRVVDNAVPGVIYNQNPATYPDWVAPISFNVETMSITLSEVDTNARTLYNLQSNCSPQQIMESSTPGHLHAIFMVAKDAAGSWTTRNIKYFYSSNSGANWTYLGNIAGARAGYGNLTVMNDGRAAVVMHTGDGTPTDVRTQLYVDLIEGTGSFTKSDPGDFPGGASTQHIWARCVSTNNNQVVFWSSINSPAPGDSAFRNRTTNLISGTFAGYTFDPNAQNAENYSLASTSTGKVCAVVVTGDHVPSHVNGSVVYMESTDNGVTWGSAITVREASIAAGSDSLGCLRGANVVYYNSKPAIVFGLAPQDPGSGGFYPNAFASIYFWTQATGLVRIDSLPGTASTNNSVNDVLTAVCRPSIGVSSDGSAIYLTWMHARADSSAAGAPFFDVFFTYSNDGGATWASNVQVTNPTGSPLKDNRWPSISKSNDGTNAYITYQQSDSAGSNVNGGPTQWSKFYLAKITGIPIGIKTIGTDVPKQYSLSQNYPNPFNPSTVIRFALPKNENVSLKIYDITGKVVAVLMNNQAVSAGMHEFVYDASILASGIYFYRINAGGFTDSKKMILVK